MKQSDPQKSKLPTPLGSAWTQIFSAAAVMLASAATTNAITLQTNSLTIGTTGALEVQGNFVIWRAPNAAQNALNLAYATAQLKKGINFDGLTGPPSSSFWQGYGIRSASAAVDPSLYAVGVLDNSLLGPGAWLYGFDGVTHGLFGDTFGGVSSLTGNEVLIRYTYTGDTDLNGFVDATDQAQYDNGFNNNLTDWINGDFTYNLDSNSQQIGPEDQSQFDNGFNSQGPPILASQGTQSGLAAPVPEPASISLLAFGMFGLALNRRKRQK